MRDRQLFRHLEDFFTRARVSDRYSRYDVSAAMSRLLRRRAQRQAPTSGCACRQTGHLGHGSVPLVPLVPLKWSDPGQDQLVDAETAWRDLNAVSVLVLQGQDATDRLGEFIEAGPADAHGALVFACLLYLIGHEEGARFWWQFAAGADSDAAAYCLFLDHARQGEYHDAALWARPLARRGFSPHASWGRRAAAPANSTLPPTLLACVTDHDHEDLGPAPEPRPSLPAAVAELIRKAPVTHAPDAPGSGRQRSEEHPCPLAPAPPATAVAPKLALAVPGQTTPATRPRWSELALRHPSVTAAAQQATSPAVDDYDALRTARLALGVVKTLEHHRLGVDSGQIGRECHLADEQLGPLLAMLCASDFARRIAGRVYFPGPALDRLAAPGGSGVGAQLQRTLALARDGIGAAVYLSHYADGDVRITHVADGPVAPRVEEWVDFRASAHASAVGKCLLTQLDHDSRAEHLARYKIARLTSRTITNSRTLFQTLDRIAPNQPVYDLREYSPQTVCSAVPLTAGSHTGSLALSMPLAHRDRLRTATASLARAAVPVLLTLLLTGGLPTGAPAENNGPLLPPGNAYTAAPTLGPLTALPGPPPRPWADRTPIDRLLVHRT